ncbi:MAG: hypothetical protein WCS31_19005 [Verrucomicrobiae bacterium]
MEKPKSCIAGLKITLAALSALAMTTASQAEVTALLSDAGTGRTLRNSPYSWGYAFTLSKDQILVSLGIYDNSNGGNGHVGDGLAEAHIVALFDHSGEKIAEVTFAEGAAEADEAGFIYATPTLGAGITLLANATYTLAASKPTDADPFLWSDNPPENSPGTASGVTILGDRYGDLNADGTLKGVPTGTFKPGGAAVGPNLTFQAVP